MNNKIKKKWLKALRSGKYKQGTEQLRKGDKFCCLGVLTDLYLKEKGLEWSQEQSNKLELSDAVMDWAGLEAHNPECYIENQFGEYAIASLSVLNDGDEVMGLLPHKFKEIAKVIESGGEW